MLLDEFSRRSATAFAAYRSPNLWRGKENYSIGALSAIRITMSPNPSRRAVPSHVGGIDVDHRDGAWSLTFRLRETLPSVKRGDFYATGFGVLVLRAEIKKTRNASERECEFGPARCHPNSKAFEASPSA